MWEVKNISKIAMNKWKITEVCHGALQKDLERKKCYGLKYKEIAIPPIIKNACGKFHKTPSKNIDFCSIKIKNIRDL